MTFQVLKEQFFKFVKTLKPKPKDPYQQKADYFKLAKSWSNDYYALMIASRNRYRAAFLSALGCCVVLVFGVLSLIFQSNVQLVVVHEGASGFAWVTTVKAGTHIHNNWLRTRSEIVNYVEARESYDPVLYQHQSARVNEMSSGLVASQFESAQKASNKLSPVNVLGAKGYRTVHVNSILKVTDNPKQNLAQVDFVIEDHFFGSSQMVKTNYTALVSWVYGGVPNTPSKMLTNWDGFEVTRYDVQPVSH